MFPPFRTRWWKVIWLFLVIIRIYKMRKVQSSLDEQELTSNLGLEKARVWEIKVMRFFVLIRLGITSIGLSLYIYRPGKTYPFTSRITWGLFTKTLILLGLFGPDRSDRSVRPVSEASPHKRRLKCDTNISLRRLMTHLLHQMIHYHTTLRGSEQRSATIARITIHTHEWY